MVLKYLERYTALWRIIKKHKFQLFYVTMFCYHIGKHLSLLRLCVNKAVGESLPPYIAGGCRN